MVAGRPDWFLAPPRSKGKPLSTPALPTVNVDPDIWPMIRKAFAGPHVFNFQPGIYRNVTIPKEWSGSVLNSIKPLQAKFFGDADAVQVENGTQNVEFNWFAVHGAARGYDLGNPDPKPGSPKTSNIRINRNWVFCCGQDGIYSIAHKTTIDRCVIEHCGSSGFHHGVYIGGMLNSVTNCRIRENNGTGVACAIGFQKSDISRNFIYSNRGYGVLLPELFAVSRPEDGISITKNTLIDNRKYDLNITSPKLATIPSTVPGAIVEANLAGVVNISLFTGIEADFTKMNMVYQRPSILLVSDDGQYGSQDGSSTYRGFCGWPKENWPKNKDGWVYAIPYADDPVGDQQVPSGLPLSLIPD